MKLRAVILKNSHVRRFSVVARNFDLALPSQPIYAHNVKALVSYQTMDHVGSRHCSDLPSVNEENNDGETRDSESGGLRGPSAATFLFSSQDFVPSASDSKTSLSDFRKGVYGREVS
jgi:hypothetical protein